MHGLRSQRFAPSMNMAPAASPAGIVGWLGRGTTSLATEAPTRPEPTTMAMVSAQGAVRSARSSLAHVSTLLAANLLVRVVVFVSFRVLNSGASDQ
jgi:hypothetical protein